MMSPHSLLFVPAVDERRMRKALSLGADAVVFDLEDAVAVSEKVGARATVAQLRTAQRPCRLYVRINGLGTPFAMGDLEIAAQAGIDGVVLPMAESECDVRIADWVLRHWELERELDVGGIEILPILETARGLERARDVLSACPRVRQGAFGAGDWCADTGMTWTTANPGLIAARFQLAVTSRACDREPPIDTAFADVRDQEAFAAEAQLARELGFGGKFCIHPDQIGHANRIFAPSPEEIHWAREVLSRFIASEADGVAALMVHDRFVDYPVARQARAILERAGEQPAQLQSEVPL